MKKAPLERTKVVIRHLPPSLSQFHLFSQFDHLFSHRYNWYCFRPGKYSLKNQRYSRAYIDFKSPGDVLEFAEFFHGHIFINEKGAQFKAIVEYAPSQRFPKYCIMKNSREGTIYEDPDYLEFLKLLAVPKETLPSAEIQLERKEAAQSGSAKEIPIITPLMEFVRQKRSSEGGKQDASVAGRGRKRVGLASFNKPSSCTKKQYAEKKKDILNRSTKKANQKGKSTNILAPRQDDRPATLETGKRITLLKGKGDKISRVPGGISKQPGNLPVSTAPKQSRRFAAGERSIKGILLSNEAHKNRPSTAIQPRVKTQNSNSEHDKRLVVPRNKQVGSSYISCSEPSQPVSDGNLKNNSDENFSTKNRYSSGSDSKRQEKHTRNKDRTNHGVPFPLSLSDIHYDNGEKLSSTTLQHTGLLLDSIEGFHKNGHRVPTRRIKKYGSLVASEQRSSKGGGANGYAVHEKQVWVQKSSSGS
ncbi:regulator of nonsense transcripts UPF3-like [Euphorbia lathyris]|uniref:regulator of nonsense transcripts UPF3-like n=1 Tax=Euphorbia lathyris TaxID=212925 RepID=UPI003313D56C